MFAEIEAGDGDPGQGCNWDSIREFLGVKSVTQHLTQHGTQHVTQHLTQHVTQHVTCSEDAHDDAKDTHSRKLRQFSCLFAKMVGIKSKRSVSGRRRK